MGLIDVVTKEKITKRTVDTVYIMTEYEKGVSSDVINALEEIGYTNEDWQVFAFTTDETLASIAYGLEEGLPRPGDRDYAFVFDGSFLELYFGMAFSLFCSYLGENVWMPGEVVI